MYMFIMTSNILIDFNKTYVFILFSLYNATNLDNLKFKSFSCPCLIDAIQINNFKQQNLIQFHLIVNTE